MSEWKTYRLSEVTDFTNGFAFKSTDYVMPSKNTIEVLRMGYIERGGGFKEDTSPVFVPKNYPKDLDRYLLTEGDIVIAMTDMKNNVAILGNTAWIKESNRFVLNQRVGCIRVLRHDLVNPRFLYYLSNWDHHVEYLRTRANSGVQVNLSTAAIKEAEINVPLLNEQKGIARILSSLDDKIELNRRMNETLEAMARAIFKDWFVDFGPTRAKQEGRNPYLPDPLWSLFPEAMDPVSGLPEGWELATLGSIAESVNRIVNPAEIDEQTPYIGLEHMPRRSIALSDWEGAGKVTSNKLRFETGEFLFGKLRPYFYKVGIAPLSGICSTDIVVVRAKSEIWSSFVLTAISNDNFVEYTNLTSTGTKMPRTSWSIMAKYKLTLPPKSLVKHFNSTIQPCTSQIIDNIHQGRTLTELRDRLLPKLMSGEIRVKEAEEIVEEVR